MVEKTKLVSIRINIHLHTFHVLVKVLSILPTLILLVAPKRSYYYHFINGNRDSERLSKWSRVTELVLSELVVNLQLPFCFDISKFL